MRAGLEHFDLLRRYDGVLVVDADSLLMPGSMRTYREHLTEGVAAVIGHLRVLKAQRGPIAAWRRHQYFWMTNVYLNGAAAYGGGFPVTPGFCTLYATSAMRHFDHDPQAPTEDIDYCWQIHRKGLGKVVYTPDAEVETAVPLTLRDYVRQILRWDRGWHYATRKHKMPIGFQWVDLVGGLMTLEMYMIWARALALVLLTVLGLEVGIFGWHLQDLLGVSFVVDAMVLMVLAFVGSVLGGNWGGVIYILVFPLFYVGDQVVNFYAAARLKRGLSAVWQSPQR